MPGAPGGLAWLFDQISQVVSQTVASDNASGGSTRAGDRYVTGGVNWNGYGLKPLIRMVADQSSPAQVDAVAGLWRDHGNSISQGSQDLQTAMNTLMQYWQGAAATQASTAVTQNTQWISTLGATATQMASPLQDASGALSSAQSTMPGAPHGGFFAGFSGAAGGAAIGAAFGGPFGAAAGAVIGGIASAFGFGSNEKKLKRQAVQTMQRYETAAMGIDTSTPGFTSSAGGVNGDQGGSAGNGGSGVGTIPTGSTVPSSTDPNLTTMPSFATDPITRWDGLTGGPGGGLGNGLPGLGGPGFGGGPGGLGPGGPGGFNGLGPLGNGGLGPDDLGPGGRGRLGGLGPLSDEEGLGGPNRGRFGGLGGAPGEEGLGSGLGRGGFGRGGFGSAADDEHFGRGASGGNIFEDDEELAGRGGAGARGSGGVIGGEGEEGMPFGRGGGRRREEDQEYKRHIPYEEDPFSTNMKVVPPVIGLRPQDKGDNRR